MLDRPSPAKGTLPAPADRGQKKRTDIIIRITAALLFTALLCYVGVYVYRAIRDPLQTAEALDMTVRESLVASGIVIREELVIESTRRNLDISVSEGTRVSKGAAIAVSYGSAAAVARASRIRELELEIIRVKTLLGALTTAEDLSAKDAAVRAALHAFVSAVSRHEMDNLDGRSLQLRSLIFANKGGSVTQEDLDALEAELAGLSSSSDVDTIPVLAPEAGIYTSVVDGYERLVPADIRYLVPDGLRALAEARDEPSPSAIGKLVTSASWHFASVMDEEAAGRLKTASSVILEFGRYFSSPLEAEITSIGNAVNGECVVVFTSGEALVETLAMRQVSADVIYAEHSGIRVPKAALYTDEDGSAYVFTLTGLQAERKEVTVIYEADGFCLVEIGADADSLKAGNSIIVSANDLYDGKVMG